jgi:hypothetical protein
VITSVDDRGDENARLNGVPAAFASFIFMISPSEHGGREPTVAFDSNGVCS